MWKIAVTMLVLFAVSIPSAQAITCKLDGFSATCAGQTGVFNLAWSYTCQCPISPRVLSEVAQCHEDGSFGPFDTVVDQYLGFKYVYDGPYSSYGVRFRITLETQGGCSCTGPVCAIESGACQTCP